MVFTLGRRPKVPSVELWHIAHETRRQHHQGTLTEIIAKVANEWAGHSHRVIILAYFDGSLMDFTFQTTISCSHLLKQSVSGVHIGP